MDGYRDAREERDSYLVVTSVIAAASSLRDGFRNWIEEEAKELAGTVEDLQVKLEDRGHLLDRVQGLQARIREIQQQLLPESSARMKERLKEVSDGVYDDVMDARRYLDEGLYPFERMQRDLLGYRQLLDTLKGEFE